MSLMLDWFVIWIPGAPIKPEAIWTIMKQLRTTIVRLLESNSITNEKEQQSLKYLVKTKKNGIQIAYAIEL